MKLDVTPPGRPVNRQTIGVVVFGLIVLAVAVALFGTISRTQPDFVRELTIENPTDATLRVAVESSSGEGLLRLGTFLPNSSRRAGSVPDQGPQWNFVVGWDEIRVKVARSRTQLEDDGWTFRLPAATAEAVHERYPPLSPAEGGGGR